MLGSGLKEREPWEGRVTLGQRIVDVSTPRFPIALLTFADGRRAEFDFGWLVDSGPAFAPLKDPSVFANAHPGSGGASLEWITPQGEEIDLSADALRMEAEGVWNPKTKQWLV